MSPSAPRFPIIAVGVFVLAVAATAVTAALTDQCAFGFGGFQCNGRVGNISGLLFGWAMLSVVVLPVSLAVAVWRLVRWARTR